MISPHFLLDIWLTTYLCKNSKLERFVNFTIAIPQEVVMNKNLQI